MINMTNIRQKINRYHRADNWIFLAVVVAVVAPQLMLLWRPVVGAYCTVVALVGLMILAARVEKARKLAISTAILPLVTMVCMCLPQSNAFAQAVVYYDALLLLALVYRFMFALDAPVRHTSLKAKGYMFTLPLMLVLGQALGLLSYLTLRNHYAFVGISLPLIAACSVVFAIAEEVYFRGLLQQRATQVLHPIMAAILSVIVYTTASVNNVTILTSVVAFISGCVLSLTYYKKQNLILTITINAISKLTFLGLLATFVL
jgi:membrane protease YdiL (CAAX protease family)